MSDPQQPIQQPDPIPQPAPEPAPEPAPPTPQSDSNLKEPAVHCCYPRRSRQLRHGRCLKQSQTGFRQPPRPAVGSIGTRAVGGNSCVGVHLTVEFRDKYERQAAAERLHNS